MPRNSQWRLPILLFVPPQPITQHASPHYASPLTPVMCTIGIRLCRICMRESIVVHTGGLVSKMLETIPLRARLRVYVYFIVHGLPICEVGEVDLLLVEFFAVKSRKLHVVKRPVKLDVFTGTDFLGGGLDNSWGKKVDG